MKRTSKQRAQEKNLSRIFLARILFSINAVLWLASGAYYVYKMIEDKNGWTSALVAFFFIIAIFSHLMAVRLLKQQGSHIFLTLMLLMGLNIFQAFFGFQDFIFIIIALLDVIILVNLMPLKGYFAT
ncbi:MAG: hypothetical protein H6635_11685 [Anaerolineales bacterium]|nr:hypothetical protein [Anaerolineales bacterium]MCB9146027.1 hypothetical protein [Anaerolineales bacterium]